MNIIKEILPQKSDQSVAKLIISNDKKNKTPTNFPNYQSLLLENKKELSEKNFESSVLGLPGNLIGSVEPRLTSIIESDFMSKVFLMPDASSEDDWMFFKDISKDVSFFIKIFVCL